MTELVITIISSSIMGTFAALAVILIKAVTARRLSPRAILYIWIPVIMRFVIPYIPQSYTSIYNYVPKGETFFTPAMMDVTEQYSADTVLQIHLLPIIWICGITVTLMIYFISYYKFIKSIEVSACKSVQFESTVKKAHEICGLKNKVRVCVFKNNMSPMITGFIRPKIFIPEKILKEFSEQQILVVLIHELTHYTRKDRLWNVVTVLVNCIHWFNPFVRFITGAIHRDVENACDEASIKIIGADKKYTYTKTLIDIAEYFSGKKFPATVSPMASGKQTLKIRIKRIYDSGKKKLSAAALPLGIILTVTMLTGAADTGATQEIEKIVRKSEPVITIQSTPSKSGDIPEIAVQNIPDEKSATVHNYNPDTPELSQPYENLHTDEVALNRTGTQSAEDISDNHKHIISNTEDSKIRSKNSSSGNIHIPSPPIQEKQENNRTNDEANTDNPDEKTYTYTGKNATLKLSNDPSKSGFKYESDDLKIETVSISSASDEKFDGYFNIYRNGELVQSDVRASVSASPSSIYFNDEHSSDNDFSFNVHTKDIN